MARQGYGGSSPPYPRRLGIVHSIEGPGLAYAASWLTTLSAICVKVASVFFSSCKVCVQKPDRVSEPELICPGLQCAVARYLVMLDRLRARQQAGVEGRRALVFLHDLLAFVDDADDGIAGLALRLLADQAEHLFEPLHLAFGLRVMLLERRPELVRLRRLRHLGQGGENFLLGEIDVLERVVKQVLERLGFFGHCLTPLCNPAPQRCNRQGVPCLQPRCPTAPLGSKMPTGLSARG